MAIGIATGAEVARIRVFSSTITREGAEWKGIGGTVTSRVCWKRSQVCAQVSLWWGFGVHEILAGVSRSPLAPSAVPKTLEAITSHDKHIVVDLATTGTSVYEYS